MSPVTEYAAGFVAAEGCFTGTSDGSRFAFAVGLGASDKDSVVMLREFFGVGRVMTSPRRQIHDDDEVQYVVGSVHDLIAVIIPFMDEHLPRSHKRDQYLAWRERLFKFWDDKAKRVRPCTVDGCDEPRRAHELCRRHLYQAGSG